MEMRCKKIQHYTPHKCDDELNIQYVNDPFTILGIRSIARITTKATEHSANGLATRAATQSIRM